LAPQASFKLGYQVFGETQVFERLFQVLGGVLCLTAVTLPAPLGFVAATLSGFGCFLTDRAAGDIWCTPGCDVALCRLSSAQPHVTYAFARL